VFVPLERAEPGLSLADVGLTAPALLAREAAWGAPSVVPAIDSYRRRAMDDVTDDWFRTLGAIGPRAVVIWNGHHVIEMILDAVGRLGGVPTLYVERAPIPQALFADERGLSAESGVAHQKSWTVADSRWRERADAVMRWLNAGAQTWWTQPASRGADGAGLRRQIGIPDGARVVLFAAQVDQDTQQFLLSPHFESNLSAFAWLLDELRGRDDVFVLGKHHPKSRTDPAAYQRVLAASGVAGNWRTDLSIGDALAAADRVAAVNSTVLYEALARGKPVLAMGEWLLGGRGAAWEIRDRARGRDAVDGWLEAGDVGAEAPAKAANSARQAAWRESLAFLLSSCVYSWAPDVEATGVPGASELAARIAGLAGRTPGWRPPQVLVDRWLAARTAGPRHWTLPGAAPPDDGREWQRAHLLRYQLLEGVAAVERGRRLIVWGAGAGGRAADALLARAGGRAAAFMSTSPDRDRVDGRPLIPPSALVVAEPRDFVLVASRAAHEIVPVLAAKGLEPTHDYHVLDVDLLAEMMPASSTS